MEVLVLEILEYEHSEIYQRVQAGVFCAVWAKKDFAIFILSSVWGLSLIS